MTASHTFFCDLCDTLFVTDDVGTKLCDRCHLVCNPLPRIGSIVRYNDGTGRIVTGTVVAYRGRRILAKESDRNRGHKLLDRWEQVT